MSYPINLVDIAAVLMAAGCAHTTLSDLSPRARKLWRIGLPPLLGIGVSLLMLAGAVVSFAHDVTWVATAALGTLAGWLRGHRIAVQTDQIWGTIRTPVSYDAVTAGFCLFAITFADSLSGLLPPGTLPRHAHMAATSGVFAGYLAGRAWSLGKRAVGAPHTDLGLQ
ncbi:MAG: hypothetical protein LCH95_16850 [Proteobacteria bacterium]|nr:hypothetical protein [Pseudomonadota bacterium]